MNDVTIEYNLVLIGWAIALLLGLVLLAIKTPGTAHHAYYRRGKNTCAAALLIFGVELLFQWIIRFHLVLADPFLSVSVYLFAFCLATLLISTGFCRMIAPNYLDTRQARIVVAVLLFYLTLLSVNYLLPSNRAKIRGIIACCGILFLINCVAIYKCVVIYRSAINSLRVYYSDFVEDIIHWMPGVGLGIMLFLVSAPITCLCPKVVGICQLALGIIMFVYTFVCIISFSYHYGVMEPALRGVDNGDDSDLKSSSLEPGGAATTTSMSKSLQEVMRDKVQRWSDNEGFTSPGITIDRAAHAMGTNRSYLSRYLNEVVEMTFYEWVAGMRIGKAQSLMRENPSMSVEQVALQVGFTSTSTFSSTFKKIAGESPKKWRNHQ